MGKKNEDRKVQIIREELIYLPVIDREEERLNSILCEVKSEMNKFLLKNYGIRLDIPVTVSSRLVVRVAKFEYMYVSNGGDKRPIPGTEQIKIQKLFLLRESKQKILRVAFHEAVHYACYVRGVPHRDGNTEFEKELQKHGLPSESVTINFEDELLKNRYQYLYVCQQCNGVVKRNFGKPKKMLSRSVKTTCCKAPVNYLGKVPWLRAERLCEKTLKQRKGGN